MNIQITGSQTSNIKDKATTIAGWLVALSGLVLALSTGGIALPVAVLTTAATCGTVGMAVIGFLNGKNPDGSSKTVEQVVAANTNTTPPMAAPIIVAPVVQPTAAPVIETTTNEGVK